MKIQVKTQDADNNKPTVKKFELFNGLTLVPRSLSSSRAARIVAALQPGCEEMKRKRRGNGERMRKWRENFLIISLYPPSLSISYIKICHILSQNVKYGIFVANVTKTEHTRYEEIILGRILCEEAPQVVSA